MIHLDEMLDGIARMLRVTVKYREMVGRDGEYDHGRAVIWIRPNLSARLHRSVLAHELAHATFGDVPSKFGPVNAKQERRADQWAALRLIDIDEYRVAESRHEGHAGAIARDLGVVRSIVEAFRDVLLRAGEDVYVRPRHGSGQWDAKTPAR